jgi:hypothetical protein
MQWQRIKYSRKWKYALPVVLIVLLAGSSLAVYFSLGTQSKPNPGVYVGVAFGGTTTTQAKQLIDRVDNYTNLFILDCGRNPISADQKKVEDVCDYAVAKGLSIIINLGIKSNESDVSNWFWGQPSLDGIKQQWTQRWGNKFLGIYYNDEVGGIQLDGSWRAFYEHVKKSGHLNDNTYPFMSPLKEIGQKLQAYVDNGTKPTADDYELEAEFFMDYVITHDPGIEDLTASGIRSFTSDYGLYWWDYKGGYDVMFAELGWNVSVAEQLALVKGAARLQDKEWGTMITWKYQQAPYMDSGDEIYNQMLASYQAGAKYVSVFDYPYNVTSYGVLTDEHFAAMEKFWNDINTKQFADLSQPVAALVLPKNFGWGLRNPNDNIWGFWLTDNRTVQVAVVTAMCLYYYGSSLDIVYEDAQFPITNVAYQKVYYWNSTAI